MRSPNLDFSQVPGSSGAAPITPGHPSPLPAFGRSPAAPSPWWKVLAGCAIGCGIVGVAAVGFLIWGAWWVVSPGSQVSTEVVLVPEAVAVVHFAGDERAQGLVQLAGAFLAESNRRQRDAASGKMPESWRWIEKLGTAQDQQAAGALGMWFPTEATLVVVPGQDASRHVLLAANFKGFVRPIRALITSSARREGGTRTVTTHAGEEVTVFANGSAMSFAGGTLLWSDEARLVEASLDRAKDELPPSGPFFLSDDAYSELKTGRVLVAAASNRTGFLTTLGTLASLGQSPDDPELDGSEGELPVEAPQGPENPLVPLVQELERATLAMSMPTGDRAEVELVLVPADATAVQAWQTLLKERFEAVRLAAKPHNVRLDYDLRAESGRVIASVRLSGLTNLVSEWAEATAREDAPSDPGIDESDSTPPPAEAPPQ